MSHRPSTRKPTSATPGVKLLMTTAALAGTLVGWAAFALKEQAAALPATFSSVVQLPALPTLVAPPIAIGASQASAPAVLAAPLRRVNAPATVAGLGAPVTVTQSSR